MAEETIEQLEARLAKTESALVKKQIQALIQKRKLEQGASSGNEVAKAILLMKEVLDATKRNAQKGGGVDKVEVEKMIKAILSKDKISKDDLDDELKNYLMSTAKVQMMLKTPSFTGAGGTVSQEDYERDLFQKMLCDLIAMNNVYLFGGAGTGKSYIAKQIADFMDWDFILLSCNQFTSQLDILGGQTIDGYQVGKLEMAWGNLDEKGNPSTKKGAILCLDELPKIDPNTAGILNAALAEVKNYSSTGIAPVILNGRNQKIKKGNLMIIGTGNVKLNEMSTEYEANFKQDLSLQDRFVGATYEVTADYEYELNKILKGFAFLWIGLVKLREKIIEMKWTGQAFVSMRIMISLRDTYITYRDIKDGKTTGTGTDASSKINKPKTLKQGLDSFLNLFKPDQVAQLKSAMDYDRFVNIIDDKDRMPLDALNTKPEMDLAERMIKSHKTAMASKTA